METSGDSPPFHGFSSEDEPEQEVEKPKADDEATEPCQQSDLGARPKEQSSRVCGPNGEPYLIETPLRNFGETLRNLRSRTISVGSAQASAAAAEARKHAAAAKRERSRKQSERSEPQAPQLQGIKPLTPQSLSWDDSGQNLEGATCNSRLWSSSTQFSVPLHSSLSNMSNPDEQQHTPSGETSGTSTVIAQSTDRKSTRLNSSHSSVSRMPSSA